MGNDIIWYILLILAYLIFGRRKKRPKQPAKRSQTISIEDALRELTGPTGEDPYQAEAPAVPPASRPLVQPAEVPPQPWHKSHATSASTPVHEQPETFGSITAAPGKQESAASPLRSRPRDAAVVASLLKNPKAARNAIILHTVLGKPHALREGTMFRRR